MCKEILKSMELFIFGKSFKSFWKQRKLQKKLSDAKEIIRKPQSILYVDICPHCNEEIHEKGIYSPDGGKTLTHSRCGGVIIFPLEKSCGNKKVKFGFKRRIRKMETEPEMSQEIKAPTQMLGQKPKKQMKVRLPKRIKIPKRK